MKILILMSLVCLSMALSLYGQHSFLAWVSGLVLGLSALFLPTPTDGETE